MKVVAMTTRSGPYVLSTFVGVAFIFFTYSNPPAAMSTSRQFQPQTRVGFTQGDQWEPAIAADQAGHVYILYPQYVVEPGCPACPIPSIFLVESSDNGTTWAAPRMIAASSSGQFDAQIKVDPVDRQTVYASWLENNKSQIMVAKSTHFGASWTTVIANSTNAGTDKDILAVNGRDVYVGYNHAQTVWVSSSHDGGANFTSVKVNQNAMLGWSLAGGAAIDTAGNVYFAWDGYTQNGGAKGPVNLYVSKSRDGGLTWNSTRLDVSGSPPDCSAFFCGWAYLGPGIALTSDVDGNLYALWNAGTVDKGPERIFYSTSVNLGATWSTKTDVSLAPVGIDHAFPAIAAGSAGDVRIAWMDARNAPLWNTYYRASKDGGATWSDEIKLSTFVPGYSYIQPNGFSFPFGDYFSVTIDYLGHTQAVWGEGLNYDTPGAIWYTRQLQ